MKIKRNSIKANKMSAKRRPVTAARITTDFSNFKPWSGAVDTWNELEKYDKIDLLEQILDDTYYNEEAGEAVMSETELNDLLWFEPESVYEWVGLYYNDETGEVSDEPFDSDDEDDEYDEDEDIEESISSGGRKAIKSNRRINKRRPVKAAESYGWELDSSEAWEAYEFACDYFGKENLDDQIVSGLSTDELADALVYIFRMNDFREWDERNEEDEEEDIEESRKLRGKKSIKANRKAIKAADYDVQYYNYSVRPNSLYYGCPKAYFIWNGAYSDAWVEYNGYLYNTVDSDDILWSEYNEWCEENGEEPNEQDFRDSVTPDDVINVLYDLTPFAKVTDSHGNQRVAEGVSPVDTLPDFWK